MAQYYSERLLTCVLKAVVSWWQKQVAECCCLRQIMAAEREFLESQLKRGTSKQQELVGHIQVPNQSTLPILGPCQEPEFRLSTHATSLPTHCNLISKCVPIL